jgi:hypothetical protein
MSTSVPSSFGAIFFESMAFAEDMFSISPKSPDADAGTCLFPCRTSNSDGFWQKPIGEEWRRQNHVAAIRSGSHSVQ